jgi:hypothetical protein
MTLVWMAVVVWTFYDSFEKLFMQKTVFEDGYNYIIIDDTESTKNPNKYSEGVFAWCEEGELKTSEEYQIENGGDPIVLKKYLLKNRKITT